MASVAKAGDLGKLKFEDVSGTAVCSLLTADSLFSFPSSRAADTNGMSYSSVVVPGLSQGAW
jgi:hypothetical protein